MFSKFIYDGVYSDYYDIICAHTSKEDIHTRMSVAETSLSTNNSSRVSGFDIITQNYSSPIVFQLQVFKNNFSEFTPLEERKLVKWLVKNGKYKKFQIDNEYYEEFFWYANISNPQNIYINGKSGMEFTVTFKYPYAYQKKIIRNKTVTSTTKNITIPVDTDDDSYVYPIVTITMLEPGNLTIENSTEVDRRKCTINDLLLNEQVTMNCTTPLISSNKKDVDVIMGKFNKNWIRLMDGDNILTFSHNCNVSFEYRQPRKVGISF